MSRNYILTDDAVADLRAIIRHTRDTWGAAQARRYAEALEHGMSGIAGDPGQCRDMGALYPELRMARCERHYLFCLPRSNAPALIVAILHERMDLMARLAGRLQQRDP
ncbi:MULTISPECIES: type II toxin-antitoxin system RelE/ParE family toxin [unclassified Haematobacter]|uniref:type II toxin-antitoxin system RelE/ParE family toxin n=1 Tax=unclassified Haematobacter TaxID=2640585 RepID=UPI0025C60712|nr:MULTISPECIES: type II toxin-antitoxin system RelE/ParE family toxin [unclassified Haematobacter]